MTDRILQKYLGDRDDGTADTNEKTGVEPTDDLGAFGWLRGVRDRAIMLELRRKDGSIKAVSYNCLESAEYDPLEGITLLVYGKEIHIRGRNLNHQTKGPAKLFEGITRHRVPFVVESDTLSGVRTANDATIIEQIEW